MHRADLLNYLKNHHTRYMDEAGFTVRATAFIEQHSDCFYRELWPAHVTGSTWVVSPDRSRVLMMHHKKLDKWFQPGGHADGDGDILGVALRETVEETGMDDSQVRLVSEDVFDVDIHSIPSMHGEPQHEHIDVRFLVEIDDSLTVPGNDESHEILWINLRDVLRYNNNRSTYRMMEKTRVLRNLVTHNSARQVS